MRGITVFEAIFHVLRLLLGCVFLYASYDKILHPQAFAQAVYNYQILPDVLINLSALVLPWMELIVGICLLLNVWMPGVTLICSGLLTIFIAALAYNVSRGLNIQCGCFSTDPAEGPAGPWTVVRDVGFWAASVYVTVVLFFKDRKKWEKT